MKRFTINIDLKTKELKEKLEQMIQEDSALRGEMTRSTFLRNLIRKEVERREFLKPSVNSSVNYPATEGS